MEAFPDYKPPKWKGTCWVCGVPSSSSLIKVGTAEGGREVHPTCLGMYIESTRPPQAGIILTDLPTPISSPEEQSAKADWIRDSFLEMYIEQMNNLQTWNILPENKEETTDALVDMNLEGLSQVEPVPPAAPRDIKKRKMMLDD